LIEVCFTFFGRISLTKTYVKINFIFEIAVTAQVRPINPPQGDFFWLPLRGNLKEGA
jgi:hypothetical protein